MREQHLIIIGGGLAGLSAGCYALRSGFRTTIVEHNLALGGVCTAWPRGEYLVDGCIHWLTGGPFQRLYEELDIVPAVPLRTLESWVTYRDLFDGFEVPFTRDLDAMFVKLVEVSGEDAPELWRLREAASAFDVVGPPVDAPELSRFGDMLRSLWEMRSAVGPMVHFRKPVTTWAEEHLRSPRLRRVFTRMLPGTTPTLFLVMVLAYLERGYLSRPVGGTAAFRDALERTYRSLGGQAILHATVDEVLVENDRARGVRLADGTMLDADAVISTSSMPETVLRLLGGRYDADSTRQRLAEWKLFEPIVLASFGVEAPLEHLPRLMFLDGVGPFDGGGRPVDGFTVRVCNDDPCFAPRGHSVLQALLPSDYQWWATRGTRYGVEKEAVAARALTALESIAPGLHAQVRMTDVATPITYWTTARSWRGAYEGWSPNAEGIFGHVKKALKGLAAFYMAGQWVEPGGGVPVAVLSGRQVIQLLCHDTHQPFVPLSPVSHV